MGRTMSTTNSTSRVGRRQSDNYSGVAVGVTAFAAMMLILIGTMQALQGLVALVNDTFFVLGEEYIFEFDITTWGWVHLTLGVIVALAGFGLFQGATWARVVAIVVAAVGILVNFLWIPYYPIWSLTLMTLNVFVIWAATAHGRDIVAD